MTLPRLNPRRVVTNFATLAVAGSLAISTACQTGPAAEDAAPSGPGRAAYSESGCAQCHSVSSQGIEASITSEQMRGPDLSQVGSEHDADWIVAYVKREQTIDGEQHRVPYSGSDEDLRAVADWLAQQQ